LIALQAIIPKAIAENYNTNRKVISEGGLVKQEQQGGELIIHLKLKDERNGQMAGAGPQNLGSTL
jgi:hypothetical protein